MATDGSKPAPIQATRAREALMVDQHQGPDAQGKVPSLTIATKRDVRASIAQPDNQISNQNGAPMRVPPDMQPAVRQS